MKRTGLLVFGVIALLMLSSGVASAKIPPFTVEASPNDPTAADVVRLTVRFWDDVEHTDPARWPDMPLFEEFLWAHPAGSLKEATPIDLRLVRPGIYRAELTVESPGTWVLCTWEPRCGGGPSIAGYPDRIELTVSSSASDPAGGSVGDASVEPSSSSAPMPLLALAALALAVAALVVRFGPRRT